MATDMDGNISGMEANNNPSGIGDSNGVPTNIGNNLDW
jgi:hypothetical protein